MRREIAVGGGHAGGQADWWHFGLGDAQEAELRVIWPDGAASDWTKVAANRFLTVDRADGVRDWTPN